MADEAMSSPSVVVLRNVVPSGEHKRLLRPIKAVAAEADSDKTGRHVRQAFGIGREAAHFPDAQATVSPGLESMRAEGYQQGHQQGLEQGLVEGRSAGREEVLTQGAASQKAVAERIDYLDRWLRALPEQWQALVVWQARETEQEMVALCFEVICGLVGDQTISPNIVGGAVQRAIEGMFGHGTVPATERLSVRVNPEDLVVLEQDAEFGAWRAGRLDASVRLLADPDVGRGGCIVEGKSASVDARLETQLSNVRAMLLEQSQRASAAMAGASGDLR